MGEGQSRAEEVHLHRPCYFYSFTGHSLGRAKFCLGFLTSGNSQIYVVWDCFCCQFLKDCCFFVSKSRKAACLGHFFGAQFYSCADVGKVCVSISLGCSEITSSSTDLGVAVKVSCRWGCLSGKGTILDYARGPHPVSEMPRDKNGGFLGAGILLYQFLPEFLGCPMDFRLTNPVLPINLSLSPLSHSSPSRTNAGFAVLPDVNCSHSVWGFWD